MATITTLNSGDTGSTSRGVINTNFTNLNSDKAETSALSAYLNKSTDDLDDINAGTTNKHLTATLESKLNGIEANADVTDATNVAAAGAVMNTGNETIAGIKTFSSSPIVPAPTTDLQAATKKYVDDNAGGAPEGTAVKSTGETGGSKFLREDGDGTCSWQAVAGGGNVSKVGTPVNNQIGVWTGDGTIEGDSKLTFDTESNKITVGVEAASFTISSADATTTNTEGGSLAITSGVGDGTGNGGSFDFASGDAGETGDGGNFIVDAGDGGTSSGAGGSVIIRAGAAQAGNSNGGSIELNLGAKSGSGTAGRLAVLPAADTAYGVLDFESITTSDKTYTFPNTTGNVVVLPTSTTGVLRADSGVVSVDTDVTDIVSAASDTAAGKVELATSAEIDTSTDATRAISPDSLAGSKFGKQPFGIVTFDGATALATGDGKAYIPITPKFNGMNIVSVGASLVGAASSSGTPTIQIARGRQSSATSAYTFTDVLSTRITIDASEYHSKDATTAAVIDTAADDLATGDILRIDVDVAGTGAQGLLVFGEAQMP